MGTEMCFYSCGIIGINNNQSSIALIDRVSLQCGARIQHHLLCILNGWIKASIASTHKNGATAVAATGIHLDSSQINLLAFQSHLSTHSGGVGRIQARLLQVERCTAEAQPLSCHQLRPSQQNMAALGIQQQVLINGEQAPVDAEITVGEQPHCAQGVSLAHKARSAQQRRTAQQRSLLGRGAPGIKHTRTNPQPRCGAQRQVGDVLKAAAPLHADAPGRQPEQAAGLTQRHRLVDHRGAQHPHHHRIEARVVEGHPGDGTAGVKGVEAVKQVAAGTGAARHQTGSAAAAATAIHQGAQAPGAGGGCDLTR